MSITYKKGCVVKAFLNGDVNVFAHGANCMNTMNSGVAKVVRELLPELYNVDQETKYNDSQKLGSLSYYIYTGDISDYRVAFNLYTQFRYSRHERMVNYGAVGNAFSKMISTLEDGKFDIEQALRIGIPKIGAGLGGGQWDVIEEIIKFHTKDYDVIVYEL